MSDREQPRIVIVGAGGRLGAELLRQYGADGRAIGFTRAQLDLRDEEAMRRALGGLEFDLLINAAAQTQVDRCETERDEAFAINAEAPCVLAEICQERGARLIHISTDYVFDGAQREPYREEDEARPLGVYGESKLAGERNVLGAGDDHLVVRVSWVFGPDRPSFVDWVVQRAQEDDHVAAVADKSSTPTYTVDIARALEPFVRPRQLASPGLLHISNGGECSWREYGQWALDCCAAEGVALRTRTVDAISLREMKSFVAPRPIYTVLATEKYEKLTGMALRPWGEAVAAYVRAQVMAGRLR